MKKLTEEKIKARTKERNKKQAGKYRAIWQKINDYQNSEIEKMRRAHDGDNIVNGFNLSKVERVLKGDFY